MINVNYTPNDTTNCNSAAQVQYTAKVNKINQEVEKIVSDFNYSSNLVVCYKYINVLCLLCSYHIQA